MRLRAPAARTFAAIPASRCGSTPFTTHQAWNGTPRDSKLALKYLREAREDGNVEAMRKLGDIYARSLAKGPDWSRAVACYLEGAELGDAECQVEVARCYEEGKGVARDWEEALKFLRRFRV